MVDIKIQEIINNAFYQNWREEMEANSRMDLDTFKSRAFFWMQSLEDAQVAQQKLNGQKFWRNPVKVFVESSPFM